MAGSSMDGLDLAHVTFKQAEDGWSFKLGKCVTTPYDKILYKRLKASTSVDLNEQKKIDVDFGRWIGIQINEFKSDLDEIDLVGVHGHTVIHQPENGISWQLGKGSVIANTCETPTVTEFRTLDVDLGGQGAPLVPLGDFILFKEFDACLNLGGIANVSVQGGKIAWDICPCNQVLNYYAEKLGHRYDQGGALARSGKMNDILYSQLSHLTYFSQKPPKSLPNNFIDLQILDSVDPIDGLHTYSNFVANQIEKSLAEHDGSKLLITGGGAFNKFLIELISKKLSDWKVIVPNEKLIAFKESLIFAFLALRKLRNEINVLASVTGASKDSSSGVIHLP